MPERILVVGHAAVTCLGRDMDSTWQGLVDGRSGIRRHASLGSDLFLQDVGGIVDNFGPGSAAEDPSVAKLGARFLHFSMAAARTAWADAGLDRLASLLAPGASVFFSTATNAAFYDHTIIFETVADIEALLGAHGFGA